jgi:hypothetical protein
MCVCVCVRVNKFSNNLGATSKPLAIKRVTYSNYHFHTEDGQILHYRKMFNYHGALAPGVIAPLYISF